MMKKIIFSSYSGLSIIRPYALVLSILLVACQAAANIISQERDVDKAASGKDKTDRRGGQKPGRRTPAQSVYKINVIVVDHNQKPVDEAEVWSPIGIKPVKRKDGWEFTIPAASKPKDGKLLLRASQNDFMWGETEVSLGSVLNQNVTIELSGVKGILQLRVVDISELPMREIKLITTGQGAIGEMTDDSGKARIRLPNRTKEYDWVELMIVEPKLTDFIIVAPHNRRTMVPPFEDKPDNVVHVILVQRGDRDLIISNNNARRALTARVMDDTAPKTANEKPTDERKKESVARTEEEFGLKQGDVDQAIRALGDETEDLYDQGVAALYAEDYPKATRLLSESLKQREEEEEKEATAEAKANVAEAAKLLGQALHEQAKYTEAVGAYQKAAEREPEDMATLNGFGVALQNDGQYSRAEEVFARLMEISKKSMGEDSAITAFTMHNLAGIYRVRGKFKEAEVIAERTLALRGKILKPDDTNLATSLTELAIIYQGQGKDDKLAKDLLEQALAIWEKAGEMDTTVAAFSLHALAIIHRNQGNYDKAESLLTEALTIWEKATRPDHPTVAFMRNSLAELYLLKGDLTRAEPLAREALTHATKAYRPDHPELADHLVTLAWIYSAQGRHSEAEANCRDALAIYEKACGKDHYCSIVALDRLMIIHSNQADYSRAQGFAERVLRISQEVLEPDHPTLADALNNLAWIHYSQGHYAKARPLSERSIQILARRPNDNSLARYLDTLASILAAQKEYMRAEKEFKRGLKLFEKLLGPFHPETALIIRSLAMLYRDWGRHAESELYFKRAVDIHDKYPKAYAFEHAKTLNEYASLLRKTKREAEAGELEKQAEAKQKK
jgi:tetratricopeptide (TPR) repeat protein